MTDHDNADETDGQNSKLSRRTALGLMGASAVGGAAASSAYSELTADRPIDVEVTDTDATADAAANNSILEISNNAEETINVEITTPADGDTYVLGLVGSSSADITGEDAWTLTGLADGETAEIEFEHENSDTDVEFAIEAFSDVTGFSINAQRSTTVSETVISDDVFLHTPVSDGDGTTLTNRRGDNGTLGDGDESEEPTWITDSSVVGGTALDFDGDDDWVSFPDGIADQTFDSTLTATAIINLENDNERTNNICGTGSWFIELTDQDGEMVLSYTHRGTERLESDLNVTVGQWHFVAVTYDPQAGEVIFRLDDDTETESIDPMPDEEESFRIANQAGSDSRYFEGQIAEVTVSDTVLSDDELDALRNRNPL